MRQGRIASLATLSALVGLSACLPSTQHPIAIQNTDNVQVVRDKLRKAEIIPTVIDDFLPSLTLSVQWSKSYSAALGNTIKPKHLQDRPSITLYDKTTDDITDTTSPESLHSHLRYVVTLTDPDAPSRADPKWSEMLHWIAANVSVSSSVSPTLTWTMHRQDRQLRADEGGLSRSSNDDLVAYKPPGPPAKTGKHRYVFLVFAPKNGTTEPLHLVVPKKRKHWGTGKEGGGVRDWARENGLVPVAANFIYAKDKKQ